MKLKELLCGIRIIESNLDLNVDIEAISSDSRKVGKNSVFVATRGTKRNGNEYINNALHSGAVAIVTDEINACVSSIPYILVRNTKSAVSLLWSNYYGRPAQNMKIVAITGTNGKTTTAYYLYNILKEARVKCGLISTIECLANDEVIETNGGGSVVDISSAMTTPDPETLYYILNIMKEKGVNVVVMEASSHALTQNRIDGIDVEIGCFTNLSKEHLDYHGSMDEYFEAKKKLIIKSKISVVNADDKYGKMLIGTQGKQVLGLSFEGKGCFNVENVSSNERGSSFELVFKEKHLPLNTGLIGKFNAYNASLAASCALLMGVDEKAIIEGIKKTECVKGRLERYKDREIYIDYAHTPEAVQNILVTVREIKKNKRIIVLFGCGGDRDKSKRSEMGKICSSFADCTIITSDNSRNENPDEIIKDILKGVRGDSSYCVIPDRREAIAYLASILNDNSVGLLLGKGHESYEINKDGKLYFSEKEILDEVLKVDRKHIL